MSREMFGAKNRVRRKLALVIGIGEYEFSDQIPKLPNTVNDANDMSSALESIDFIVTKRLHLTRSEFKHTLIDFEESIQSDDTVLFFFAGHGVQWEDQNYLIPKDFPGMDDKNLNRTAIHAKDILNTLSDRNPFVIIFLLDCCRIYHLRNSDLDKRSVIKINIGSADLKPMHKVGSLIAFACAPGSTAIENTGQRNGLFTKHLLNHITTPNEDIAMILRDVRRGVLQESNSRQVPFVDDGLLEKNIYLCSQPRAPTVCGCQIDIHPNATWKQNGVTVAGGNVHGNGMNQLTLPRGFYIDDDQMIYIADWWNNRVMKWKCGATIGQVVAGGNGKGNGSNQLHKPLNVIVDKERDSLIICDYENKRVVRWPYRNNGVTKGETIISNIGCTGLTMDENGFLYVVDNEHDEVKRYRIDGSDGIVVAGGNGHGKGLHQFSSPQYVFVDRNRSVYVSERGNFRVLKWKEGAKEGTIVAGGNGLGSSLTQLNCPQAVVVDQLGTVYVVDHGNHRIVRWPKGSTEGTVIAGGNGKGNGANQLNEPVGLSYDRHGNLYVTDQGNHRVQKFDIE